MRLIAFAAFAFLLTGCQATGGAATKSQGSVAAGDALAVLARLLPGQYDNHEQVVHAAAGAALLRVEHELVVTGREHDAVTWLWRLRTTAAQPLTVTWLMRAEYAHSGHQLRVTPFRPLVATAADAAFADSGAGFHFVAGQWAELAPCGLDLSWDGTKVSAAANVDACSALLPGLGESAALLPLRFSLDGDLLRVATFADSPRGADAAEEARRVRWFEGWAVINGGGPQAKAGNQDWHFDRDLRLSSEGGRTPLRWRDGTASGWSLELERTSYPERKLSVLQLNVIEDASGKVVTYAWTDPQATAIGMNLGWLQLGFAQSAATARK